MFEPLCSCNFLNFGFGFFVKQIKIHLGFLLSFCSCGRTRPLKSRCSRFIKKIAESVSASFECPFDIMNLFKHFCNICRKHKDERIWTLDNHFPETSPWLNQECHRHLLRLWITVTGRFKHARSGRPVVGWVGPGPRGPGFDSCSFQILFKRTCCNKIYLVSAQSEKERSMKDSLEEASHHFLSNRTEELVFW